MCSVSLFFGAKNLKQMKKYTEKELIKAMIWAENNGKHYAGTDKEGQLKQFTNWIKDNL